MSTSSEIHDMILYRWQISRDVQPSCSCGWDGEDCPNEADADAQWNAHCDAIGCE